jgi:hypothetical protein
LNADEFITAAIRGIVIDSDLAQLARWAFLVSEAEVDCDKDGIDSFVDRYGARGLTDLGCAYESIGAAELAVLARRTADSIPLGVRGNNGRNFRSTTLVQPPLVWTGMLGLKEIRDIRSQRDHTFEIIKNLMPKACGAGTLARLSPLAQRRKRHTENSRGGFRTNEMTALGC